MVTTIIGSKKLAKHISSDFNFNLIQIKSGIKICVDVSAKIQQNIIYTKNNMFGILVDTFLKLVGI